MTRTDLLNENELVRQLREIERVHRELKAPQYIGFSSGLQFYTTDSGNTYDIAVPFDTGSMSTEGTIDTVLTFTADRQSFPYGRIGGAVWIDVADDAHLLNAGVATGPTGTIGYTQYFDARLESMTEPNVMKYDINLTVHGSGTALIKWSIFATDTGTQSYAGTYAWGATSGSFSG